MNHSATASQILGNPERKNTPYISDLVKVKFLLKKRRVFFFRGSAFQVFRWRNNADEVLQKQSFRERICQNFGSFIFECGNRKWKRRSLGGIRFGWGFFWRNVGGLQKKSMSQFDLFEILV